jgi:hypothetical protein
MVKVSAIAANALRPKPAALRENRVLERKGERLKFMIGLINE